MHVIIIRSWNVWWNFTHNYCERENIWNFTYHLNQSFISNLLILNVKMTIGIIINYYSCYERNKAFSIQPTLVDPFDLPSDNNMATCKKGW